MDIPKLTAPNRFSKKYEDFPIGGLRHLIFHEEENGLAEVGAIVRVGRKVLIDEEKFFTWVLNRGAAA